MDIEIEYHHVVKTYFVQFRYFILIARYNLQNHSVDFDSCFQVNQKVAYWLVINWYKVKWL